MTVFVGRVDKGAVLQRTFQSIPKSAGEKNRSSPNDEYPKGTVLGKTQTGKLKVAQEVRGNTLTRNQLVNDGLPNKWQTAVKRGVNIFIFFSLKQFLLTEGNRFLNGFGELLQVNGLFNVIDSI